MTYHKIDWKMILHKQKRVKKCAEEWETSPRRLQIYCAEGRIEKAIKYGQIWLIPRDAQKPPEKEKRRQF